MRTKHVLMTTAFAALFAACSNEDFLDNVQNVPSTQDAQRPTVDNVFLNLVEDNAETRLGFGLNGYAWEEGDVIGALLMDDWNDNVLRGVRPSTVDQEKWADFTWTERYILSDQIHTDYPFTRQEDGSWTCGTKMQEGNYFFAFPFASYQGKREALHDLSEQVQDGVTTESLQEAYAKNNFFIGYARIKAGTESDDVVSTNLKMTPVLGAVGITVKNVGVESFTVKKIVLKTPDSADDGFSTIIKIDPTDAEYKGEDASIAMALPYYNVNEKTAKWANSTLGTYFNYANYEEMTFDGTAWNYNDKFTERYTKDGELVNNTEKSLNYNRDNALRAIINPVEKTDHRVELTVTNSPVLKSTQSANFIIMTNIYKYDAVNEDNTITADIYTDRGMIKDVEISNVKGEVAGSGVTVISENPIVEIAPNKVNKVTLEIDNNSVQAPHEMNIFNEEDLVQFIEWNQTMRRPYTATLKNNITLTKEISDLLTKEGVNSTLIVENGDKKLTIAKDAATNILDYVLVNGNLVIENALVLDSKSYVKGTYTGLIGSTNSHSTTNQKIKIAENASVTVSGAIESKTTGDQKNKELVINENKGILAINADVNKLTVTENRGTMEVNAVATIAAASKNMQNATLTIGANGNLACAGKLTNQGLATQEEYAVIYNNGKIYNLVNAAYGKVIVGEEKGIVTNVNSNAGIIDISANIEADINKKDEGTIAYTVAKDAAVTMKSIKEAKITELTVDGGSVTSVKTDGVVDATTVKKVIVTENGGAMGIKEIGSTFSNAAFEINGDVTLYNLTIGGDIDVKAGTTTIRGTVDAKNSDITLASYDDKKYVSYDATLNVATSTDTLIAASIAKVSGQPKAGEAKVSNQGSVKLANTNVSTVVWTGNNATNQDAVYTDKTVNLTVVYNTGSTATTGNPTTDSNYVIAANAGFKTLNSLVAKDWKDDNNKINYKYVVKEVVIESDLSFNNDATNAAQFKALVAGKKVTLKAKLIYCDPSYNISMGDLVLDGSEIQIGSGNTTQTRTFLTVNSIDYSKVTTTLTINAGYIQIVGESQVGLSDGVTYNSGVSKAGNGKLVITNKIDTNELLEWDFTTNKWKKI